MNKTWEDLHAMFPSVDQRICIDIMRVQSFEEACKTVSELINDVKYETTNITPEKKEEMSKKLKEMFPMMDNDIIEYILDGAKFNFDMALDACKQMISVVPEFNKNSSNENLGKILDIDPVVNPYDMKSDDEIPPQIIKEGNYLHKSEDYSMSSSSSSDEAPKREGGLLQQIKELCPSVSDEKIIEFLEKTNYSFERTVELLFQDQPNSKHTTTKKVIPAIYKPSKSKSLESLIDIFPETDPTFLEEVLRQSNGRVEGAVATLLASDYLPPKPPEDPIEMLQSTFVTAGRDEIAYALRKTNGDVNMAAELLARGPLQPPDPEDELMEAVPGLSAEKAKKTLEENKGDLEKAIEASFKTSEKRFRRKERKKENYINPAKTITFDLHNYDVPQTIEYVNKIIKTAKGRYAAIYFITGRGNHSKDHVAILRPLVIKMCRDAGAEYVGLMEGNPGVVECRFVSAPGILAISE